MAEKIVVDTSVLIKWFKTRLGAVGLDDAIESLATLPFRVAPPR